MSFSDLNQSPFSGHLRAGADYRLSLDAVEIQLSVLARARLDALARSQPALGNLEDAVQRPLAPGEAFLAPESPAINKLPENR